MAQTKQGAIKIAAKKRNMSVSDYLIKIKTHKFCSNCKYWVKKKFFNVDKSRCDGLSYKCHNCIHSKNPYASLKGRVSTFKGKKHSIETKKILSDKMMGKSSPMLGKKHTIESRIKMSKTRRERNYSGKKIHSYKDGKTKERRGIRFSKEYKRWRFDVFSRDKFTCQNCKDDKGGNLNAHHIKPFAKFPDLRFEIYNGITLCEVCHKKEHQKL